MRGRSPRPSIAATLAAVVIGAAAPGAAFAGDAAAILHEPLPPDPAEDLAMNVTLAGNLPAAIRAGRSHVGAPDPERLPSPSEPAYSPAPSDRFHADRDTRRPQVGRYDDPFTPSTSPFKRMRAFDGVHDDATLYVRDELKVQLPIGGDAGPGDDSFFSDFVVDLVPGQLVPIPSVGPGARIVRARLGVGAADVAFRVLRDGAENWFLEAQGARPPARARLVMQLAMPRAAFGGPTADLGWADLPRVAPLPERVALEAASVRAAIGVSRRLRPRAALAKLVQYFREFTDSDEPPRPSGSVYVDLALSKKGVCRHRSFAFMITAQSMGIPTRLVYNEAHAWVEVHDGRLWSRIDLGGSGTMTPGATDPSRPVYDPPEDGYRWPRGKTGGDEMVAQARAQAAGARALSSGQGGVHPDASDDPSLEVGQASPVQPGPSVARPARTASAAAAAPAKDGRADLPDEKDGRAAPPDETDRPRASIALEVPGTNATRGTALAMRGRVEAGGAGCDHVPVEISLRDIQTRRELHLGTLATDEHGAFVGAIVIPTAFWLGDYDVIARTPGGAHCTAGSN